MATAVEYLIVGQGLAGTALAWELLWRGREVLVVDAGEAVTSSKIAAGLITPITGQRLALSWRVAEMLTAARPFYERVADEVGAGYFHDRIVRRIFRSAAESALWERRRDEPARQPFIAQAWVPEAGPFGGVELFGAHLDCTGYLAASRAAFERRGAFEERGLDPREAAAFPARRVIFCQGFAAAHNPLFPWIAWKAAKGEILTLRTSGLDERTILSAGQWLMVKGSPRGAATSDPGGPGQAGPAASSSPSQVALTGSTYGWDPLDTVPTAAGRAQLQNGLADLHGAPFDVIGHHAAVRPIIRESQALIGLHPANETLGFFNGLGSKGSLHAPFFARQLAQHLVDGAPLEEGCDLRRNA